MKFGGTKNRDFRSFKNEWTRRRLVQEIAWQSNRVRVIPATLVVIRPLGAWLRLLVDRGNTRIPTLLAKLDNVTTRSFVLLQTKWYNHNSII